MNILSSKKTNYVVGDDERVEFYDQDTEDAIALSKSNEEKMQQLVYRINTTETENQYLRDRLKTMELFIDELNTQFADAAYALQSDTDTEPELDYVIPDNVSSDKSTTPT